MRRLKLLLSLTALMLFLCAAPIVRAAVPLELNMESVAVENGNIKIYCNTNSETVPVRGDFSSMLGNSVLSVRDVATVVDEGAGTSYIFLVDVSGSIGATHFQAMKDTIGLICDGLADNDNISIFTIGNKTYTQPFVSSREDIQAQIEAIERSMEDTNLYEGIFTSLATLSAHADSRDKKALVVFSDGEEDIFEGITIDEVGIKVRDSHIPVYTIAMLGKNPPARYVDSAKILGSFARLSAGGRHYIHDLDRSASEEIASDILDSIHSGLIVSVDLSGFRSNGEDMVLRLELNITGVGTAGDGYAIPTAGLTSQEPEPPPAPPPAAPSQEPQPSQEPTPTPPPVSSSLPEPDQTPQSPEPVTTAPQEGSETSTFLQENLIWVIVGGAALFLVILAALTAIIWRKKHKGAAQPTPVPAPNPASLPPKPGTMPAPRTKPIVPPDRTIDRPADRTIDPEPPHGKPGIALKLTKIGHVEEQVYNAEFAGELTIGRDAARANLPFSSDELLSGEHCSISYEPEGLVLRDFGSTNGTYVNGIPISERYILEKDDIILIGSMELRVSWEEL